MAKKHRGLGMSVDALLSQSANAAKVENDSVENTSRQSCMVAIDKITPNRMQPRTQVAARNIETLACSIRRDGILQPLLVRPSPDRDGTYELIAGERRWQAAMQAGLHEVPVVIRDSNDQSSATLALIENIQREDLSALEKAAAIKRLIETFDLTHQAVADHLGQSRSSISNLLRLLQLAPQAMNCLREGQIEEGHARALLGLPTVQQAGMAGKIIAGHMSVHQTEVYVRQLLNANEKTTEKTGKRAQADAETERLQRELGEQLGTPVRIAHRPNGHGELIIYYANLDILQGVLAKIGNRSQDGRGKLSG